MRVHQYLHSPNLLHTFISINPASHPEKGGLRPHPTPTVPRRKIWAQEMLSILSQGHKRSCKQKSLSFVQQVQPFLSKGSGSSWLEKGFSPAGRKPWPQVARAGHTPAPLRAPPRTSGEAGFRGRGAPATRWVLARRMWKGRAQVREV